MTTIVATRTALGGDSKVTVVAGAPYRTKKVDRTKNCLFGAAGNSGDCARFLDWARTNFDPERRPRFKHRADDDAAILLIVNKDGIFIMEADDAGPELIDLPFYAVGSGALAALGAMEMGATMEQALDIAARYDDNTGAPFVILTLDEKK